MAILYGAAAVMNILVLKRLGICSTLASGMVVIAPLIVVACYPFILVLQIDAFFFSLALLLYAISSRWQMRAVLCLLYVPFSGISCLRLVNFFFQSLQFIVERAFAFDGGARLEPVHEFIPGGLFFGMEHQRGCQQKG